MNSGQNKPRQTPTNAATPTPPWHWHSDRLARGQNNRPRATAALESPGQKQTDHAPAKPASLALRHDGTNAQPGFLKMAATAQRQHAHAHRARRPSCCLAPTKCANLQGNRSALIRVGCLDSRPPCDGHRLSTTRHGQMPQYLCLSAALCRLTTPAL